MRFLRKKVRTCFRLCGPTLKCVCSNVNYLKFRQKMSLGTGKCVGWLCFSSSSPFIQYYPLLTCFPSSLVTLLRDRNRFYGVNES
jgi:hypothetical protein